MTIAITQFVAASITASTGSSTIPTAEGIVAGSNFASLILGQLPELTATATLPAEAGTAESAQAATDPAQIFAELGLPILVGTSPLPALPENPATPVAGESSAVISAQTSGTHAQTSEGVLDITGRSAITILTGISKQAVDGSTTPPVAESLTAAKLAASAVPQADLASGPTQSQPLAETALSQFVRAIKIDMPRDVLSTFNESPAISASTPPAQGIMAAQGTGAQTQTNNATALQLAIPVRDAAWPAEFAQKVTWMARQDLQSAQITLNPPQLGPIEISLDIRNDQASAVFVSASAEVREAIESAVPRLREMLAGVGVELGQANVSHQSFRNGNGETRAGSGNAARDGASENSGGNRELAAAGFVRSSGSGRGLVDTFA